MSMIQSDLLLGQEAGAGYTISRSLRFNSSDSAYCSRVPSTAGNRKTWTWAGWVKRSAFPTGGYNAGAQELFTAYSASNDAGSTEILFLDNQLTVNGWSGTWRKTTAVYRDPSAWYHIVVALDTTQATASNRLKIYVNGSQVTDFATSTDPSQNADLGINNASAHAIGRWSYTSPLGYFDGYLADVHFIDGQALTPSSFTEVSATTGRLEPKQYVGSFGTNGFWLKFSDNSAATATTIGKDYSGNSNNWSPSNLSVTAGAGNDSLVDTPTSAGTDTGVGGVVTGNYCTFNPIARSGITNATLANGNLDISGTGGGYTGCLSTIAVNSGKWYYEFTVTNAPNNSTGGGIVSADSINQANGGNAGFGDCSGGYLRIGGVVYNNGSAIATGLSSIGTNDILNVAFDLDAGKIWFGKNGTWDSSGNPAAGTGAVATFTPGGRSFYIFAQGFYSSGTWSGSLNTGARPFAYTAPSGFKALCDTNLPAPVVAKPNTVMDVKLYTGNGSTQTISGLGFSPDLVWIKSRSNSYNHYLVDTVRGFNGANARVLQANLTDAESSGSGIGEAFTAFTSDGFTVKDPGGWWGTNQSSATYVGWAFDAGTTTTTNTAGSITSQVRANPSAGFSIVTYTGTGANATVGHGLGVAPGFIIIKDRTAARTGDQWPTYHSSIGAAGGLVYLNSTNAGIAASVVWNNTNPSSTVFTLGNWGGINYSGDNFVAYCFAQVAGYSSFGSYTGNGSSDGPFVWCGFRPRWILIKASSAAGAWILHDTARSTYNVMGNELRADLSDAEYQVDRFDLLSNGFKVRSSNSTLNASSVTYIYFAVAESPFAYSRAR